MNTFLAMFFVTLYYVMFLLKLRRALLKDLVAQLQFLAQNTRLVQLNSVMLLNAV